MFAALAKRPMTGAGRKKMGYKPPGAQEAADKGQKKKRGSARRSKESAPRI